jgi:hypothetical protein
MTMDLESPSRADYDTPWKNILDIYFQPFMEICHPEAAKAIDWSKGYEPLDKELNSVIKESETGKRIADKLMKVSRLDGAEAWVLLHVEVQGQKEKTFEQRMYVYNYRLFDRYGIPVVSLAVLADSQPSWHPSSYQSVLWGCQVNFDFVSIKLLDYDVRQEELIASANPFAVVILAHLAAIKTKRNEGNRFSLKLTLTRSLYDKGWGKDAVLNLYAFIDFVMALSEPLELQYLNEIERFEQERHMTYITSAERIGIQKGILEGEKAILLRQLHRKFGIVPDSYQQRVEEAKSEELLEWADCVITARTLKEIFRN